MKNLSKNIKYEHTEVSDVQKVKEDKVPIKSIKEKDPVTDEQKAVDSSDYVVKSLLDFIMSVM